MPQSTNDNEILENNEKPELSSRVRRASVTALDVASSSPPDNFNPGWRFYASFTSLCIITLGVALDATSLSVALPVIDLSMLCFINDRRDTLRYHRLKRRGVRTDLTINHRSSPNPFMEAPLLHSGAGHRSFYLQQYFNPPSLRSLTSAAVNLSFSSHSSYSR